MFTFIIKKVKFLKPLVQFLIYPLKQSCEWYLFSRLSNQDSNDSTTQL